MDLERQNGEILWFKKENLKVKLKFLGNKSEVWIILDGYNICFILVFFDFIQHLKEELLLDIAVKKVLNGQRIFIIDSENALEFINYIPQFIKEWNVEITSGMISDSDYISDEIWYSLL